MLPGLFSYDPGIQKTKIPPGTKITRTPAAGAMPSGLAESARRALKEADTTGLVLQRSARSQTGFTNVIPVKDKFQARLQVAGDGRGGVRKRKQHSLPGLFSTALEAAQFLALFKKEYDERGYCGERAG